MAASPSATGGTSAAAHGSLGVGTPRRPDTGKRRSARPMMFRTPTVKPLFHSVRLRPPRVIGGAGKSVSPPASKPLRLAPTPSKRLCGTISRLGSGRARRGLQRPPVCRHAHCARPRRREVGKLTTARIRRWHESLATKPKLVRSRAGAETRRSIELDHDDPEAVRARRASANRILTILKAALNHAYHENHIANDEAWRKAKPFREVDSAVVRYLTGPEAKRLANACEPDFRQLVQAALLTGCRYGELIAMRVGDFNPDSGTLAVRKSKSGRARHVVLTSEGQRLFEGLTAGRVARDGLFVRCDGKPWGASHQQRPLEAASARARIEPAATFHICATRMPARRNARHLARSHR